MDIDKFAFRANVSVPKPQSARRAHITLVPIAVFLSVAAYADDLLILDYKSARKSPLTRQYVAATGEALYLMNYRLQRLNQKVLYCPPENMRLLTDNYINILDTELERQGHNKVLWMSSTADVLLDGLIRTYPCK